MWKKAAAHPAYKDAKGKNWPGTLRERGAEKRGGEIALTNTGSQNIIDR